MDKEPLPVHLPFDVSSLKDLSRDVIQEGLKIKKDILMKHKIDIHCIFIILHFDFAI
jgi:hypothetical protein